MSLERNSSRTVMIETGDDFNLNIGDESYFAAMVDAFKTRDPKLDIAKLTHDPRKMEQRYGIRGLYSGKSMLKRLTTLPALVRGIRQVDLYVIGGGQVICDPTILLALVLRLSRSFMAIALGKKVMGYALGVGPLHRSISRWLVKKAFNRYACVTVRDEYSRQLLQQCGVIRCIHITADPCLILEPSPADQVESILRAAGVPEKAPERPRIIMAPYGPAFHRMKSILPAKCQVKLDIWPPQGRERLDKYLSGMAAVADHLVQNWNAHICFVAMDASPHHGGDNCLGRRIQERMAQSKRATIAPINLTAKDVLAIIGTGDLVVGSRLHSLIMAARMSVPMVGVAFEQKTVSFMEIMKLSAWTQRAESWDVKRIIGQCDEILSNPEPHRKHLGQMLEQNQQLGMENVDRLFSLLNSEQIQ
jgi:polysaccharide pyruvyl transferase CsaB